ncbi:MAG TPA: hypothetical protein VKR42_05575 [Ktedonobacteraceae bacterium]|nr:hypothetical protein [Ktedonobacteraceae bacterium]
MLLLLHIVVFLLGASLVVYTLGSAIRTFVLPRSASDMVSFMVFLLVFRIFSIGLSRVQSYERKDRMLAFYAPISLLALPVVWLALVLIGYMGMFWALGVSSWWLAFNMSGSSLLTLGFAQGNDIFKILLTFSEAAAGLILVALLISYLPTMYSAFSRRESAVSMLAVRAGTPPSAVTMLTRYYSLQKLDKLSELWETWEMWFVDVEESHTSLAALSFYRSPRPQRSWVTAAGAVLDAASLITSTVDVPHDPQAGLCIQAGFLALQHVADFFSIPYNSHPQSDDPIRITREEYDIACEQLAREGVPLKADREQTWKDFAGWRVNYDTVLIALATLTMAPEAPWSSDRRLETPHLSLKLRRRQ